LRAKDPSITDSAFPELPSPRHALVVDSAATSRRVLRDVLGSWSFQVNECSSVEQAVESLASLPRVDLVFADLSTVSRCDAVRVLNEAAGGRKIEVVALVTSGRRPIGSFLAKEGWAGLLRKPLKYSQLRSMMFSLEGRPGPQHTTKNGVFNATTEMPVLPHARVLVVEDNRVNQKVAKRLLARFEINCDLADDGGHALEIVQDKEYDLILMDWQMPVMDGIETTKRIRALGGRTAGIPIVAMTANAMEGDRERCIEAGMNDYMSKPVTPEKLLEVLRRWLVSQSGGNI
jgi:CheY-like chemotaxis protein